jgi:hypothetical protein
MTAVPHGFIAWYESDEYSHVVVHWGGGFESWGLAVGNTNFVSSKQPALKAAPGVYFWHD